MRKSEGRIEYFITQGEIYAQAGEPVVVLGLRTS